MSDLGSDSGKAALELEAKLAEAILKFLEKVFFGVARTVKTEIVKKFDAGEKLKKAQWKNHKGKIKQEKVLKKIEGKKGFVKHSLMKKAGKPLVPIGMLLPEGEFKRIAEMAKRYGVPITGVKSKNPDKDGKIYYQMECFREDLEKIKNIVDRCNQEMQMENLNKQIDELNEKENLTDAEQEQLNELLKQKEAMQKKACDEMNQETAEQVVNEAMYGEETTKEMNLSEALNKYTGRTYDRDLNSIVVDATDPSKYILCHGQKELDFENKEYTKTEYRVFSDGKEVFATHDGRFQGKPVDYWQKQKHEIMSKGGFSGTFLKFYNKEHYERWAEEVKSQNQQELGKVENDLETSEDKIVDLKKQLEERGAEYKDGFAYDTETGKPIMLKEDMTNEQRINASEVKIIAEQIKTYETLQTLETKQSLAKTKMMTYEEHEPEYQQAKEELYECSKAIQEKQAQCQKLTQTRKNINAVQSDIITKNAPQQEKGKDKKQDKTRGNHKLDDVSKELDKKKKEADKKNGEKSKSVENGKTTKSKGTKNVSTHER